MSQTTPGAPGTPVPVVPDTKARQLAHLGGYVLMVVGKGLEIFVQDIAPLIAVKHPGWVWVAEAVFWSGIVLIAIRKGYEYKKTQDTNYTPTTVAVPEDLRPRP